MGISKAGTKLEKKRQKKERRELLEDRESSKIITKYSQAGCDDSP
jgi:hypothetical protein